MQSGISSLDPLGRIKEIVTWRLFIIPMTSSEILQLLLDLQGGQTSLEDVFTALTNSPVATTPFASIDLDRKRRCGFPEVVFAEGKTPEWLAEAIQKLHDAGQDCFATRLNDDQAAHMHKLFPQAEQDRVARTFWMPMTERMQLSGQVTVITAGTSDLPVAREALVTAQVMGCRANLIVDVGVAGLHRLLSRMQEFASADAIVVVAGMDGALPSVVGGLVACPVIAVPTSIGYGTAFHGLAPLLTMLNACAANVVTVNIDAGFKAGYTAALIARRSH
jgi:NCAIR mutase (PurE)-related protein